MSLEGLELERALECDQAIKRSMPKSIDEGEHNQALAAKALVLALLEVCMKVVDRMMPANDKDYSVDEVIKMSDLLASTLRHAKDADILADKALARKMTGGV